jgi:XTP/dITP diphosphohydrolase
MSLSIVFASNNLHKINEIQQLIPAELKLLSLDSIGCVEEIPETALTIEGNAILKANYVTEKYGHFCFADDTGLEVEALNGEPGVYSARYAGEQKNANDNMQKLLKNLEYSTHRNAQFKTIICLNINGEQHLFEGIVKGKIGVEPKGNQGFGYDPIFIPDGYTTTFAEMSMEEKSKISHRGLAVEKLVRFLTSL